MKRAFLVLVTVVVSAAGVGLGGLGVSPASAASPSAGPTYGVKTELNLCYQLHRGACVGGISHEFDAYVPVGTTQKTPGVILLHEGSHKAGDKSQFDVIGPELAADGMAAFAINYTLDTPTLPGYPLQVNDVNSAISYLKTHAHSFGVDSHRMALFGGSAGADLALETGLTDYQQGNTADEVQALVGWSGGYDYLGGGGGPIGPQQLANVTQYLGCNPENASCTATATAASAVGHVQPGDPPVLLAYSTDYQPGCEIVDPLQATELAGDLQAAGDTVQSDPNNLCAHALAYSSYELPNTVAFLEAHLFVAPTINSPASKTIRIGTPSTVAVKAKGDPTPSLSESGALPGGITFVDQGDGTGALVGTAVAGSAGTYPITVTATNGGLPNAVQPFTLVVKDPRG